MEEHGTKPGERPEGVAPDQTGGAQHCRFTIRRELKRRLDHYLRERLPNLSRSRLQRLINEGAVTLNERTPKPSSVLHAGDVIDLWIPPPPIKQVNPEPIPLDVLYEDESLIVVNKQAGLVVHPGRNNTSSTLVHALAWYFRDVAQNGLEALSGVGVEEFRPGIVHRLDKDTTGCIVVAKNDETHYALSRQFERRQVQKHYLALVHGEMVPPGGVVDEPVGRHPTVTEANAVRHDASGRPAVTLYRVREVFDGYSLVEVELKSGRSHQIRVHLAWLGHPIVSDIMYGGEPLGTPEVDRPPWPKGGRPWVSEARSKERGIRIWERMAARSDLCLRRPALHAARLRFTRPRAEREIDRTAPLPPDMAETVRTLRSRRRGGSDEGAAVDLEWVC